MISQRSKNAGLKELSMFDNFQVDKNLPKHRKDVTGEISYSSNDGTVPQEAWVGVPSSGGIWVNGRQIGGTFRERLINFFLRRLEKHKSTRSEEERMNLKTLTVVEFFTSLTKSFKELTPIADIAEYYGDALIQAKTMGQVALLQNLEDNLDMVRGEAHLIAMGLKKYVSEKQVVTFYEKVGEDKNLKLTWIKNFGRIIPEEIYEAKKDVDEREIFDNYVILHYDPENNGEKLTKEEVEKKKDPILFGVIKNSRKLYYVGDWKDEYCDLTLEEMFTHLKGRALTINNRSVKTYIDRTKANHGE